ncbi:hypothetical protein [Tetragenococcus halophilus]|uniref:hypothetical protein n=1 Tax=Tetragenococcus halophilus TaxID=51669 RepID=UPI001B67C130|nr:hypothetical protein [Tetragenococcus halophilus]MCO8287038.1 hypothetical protein [Tetragenococcus halophilus]GLL51764.1 hypothetical protein YA5_017420 [Tetragenococcus halophilus]
MFESVEEIEVYLRNYEYTLSTELDEKFSLPKFLVSATATHFIKGDILVKNNTSYLEALNKATLAAFQNKDLKRIEDLKHFLMEFHSSSGRFHIMVASTSEYLFSVE